VGAVQWLLDRGAAINEGGENGCTALWGACSRGHLPVVKLLLERGADPSISTSETPLMTSSYGGHLEIVRFLLGLPSAKATINRRDRLGKTALWWACIYGHGGGARALLESGADPTTAAADGTTPMAIAKQAALPYGVTAEGRRECVAALEVRLLS
jgi:uncharacterized protein